jgi:hypothetical protein
MGTRLVVNLVNLQGYSSDEKSPADDGSTYHVLDTGEVFVAHERGWVLDKRLAYAVKMAAFI